MIKSCVSEIDLMRKVTPEKSSIIWFWYASRDEKRFFLWTERRKLWNQNVIPFDSWRQLLQSEARLQKILFDFSSLSYLSRDLRSHIASQIGSKKSEQFSSPFFQKWSLSYIKMYFFVLSVYIWFSAYPLTFRSFLFLFSCPEDGAWGIASSCREEKSGKHV